MVVHLSDDAMNLLNIASVQYNLSFRYPKMLARAVSFTDINHKCLKQTHCLPD